MKSNIMLRKFAAIVMTLAMALSCVYISYAGDASKLTVQPQVPLVTANLTYQAKGEFTVKLVGAYTGDDDITYTLTPDLSAYESSIALKSNVPSNTITSTSAVSARETTFTFSIINATSRIYTIPFVAKVGSTTKAACTASVQVFVGEKPSDDYTYEPETPVTYKPSAMLGFSVTSNSGKISYGVENKLSVSMTNNGDCMLTSCEIQMGTLPSGIAIYNGTNRKQIGNLGPKRSYSSGYTSSAAFNIHIDNTVKSGIYEFPVTLSGYEPNGTRYSVTEILYLQVFGTDNPVQDDTGSAVRNPRLMVTSYTQNGTAMAGSTFGINLTITNTSSIELRNIKATVGAGSSAFVPSGMSNSYYIESIAAGDNDTHTMRFTVDSDAAQGTSPISVSLSYEDKNGNTYEANDTIAIPVKQETRLIPGNISSINWAYAGETVNTDIPIYNMGKNTINNVRVSVSGNFDVTKNQNVYVGNLASGNTYTYKFNMVPYEAGTASGTVTIVYDDAAGFEQTTEIPFTYEVQGGYEDPGMWEDPGVIVEPVPEKTFPVKTVVICVAVLAVAAFVVIKVIKKKKAAKDLELTDFDDLEDVGKK